MKVSEVDYLRIISQDNQEFIIAQNAILLCPGFLKAVEDATSADSNRAVKYNMPYGRAIVKVVLEYVHYKMRYSRFPDYAHIPTFKVPPNIALEVFAASQLLGI